MAEEKLPQKIDVCEKPAPKKRGRNRKIDIENEKLQQSKKGSQANKNSQLPTMFEPPVKRTRKESVEPTRFYSMNNSSEGASLNKSVLFLLLDKICSSQNFKDILMDLEKENKKSAHLIKKQVDLNEIKKLINSGEINNVMTLELNIFRLAVTAISLNPIAELENKVKTLRIQIANSCENLRPAIREDTIQVQHNYCGTKRKRPPLNLADDDEFCFAYLKQFITNVIPHTEPKDVSVVNRKGTYSFEKLKLWFQNIFGCLVQDTKKSVLGTSKRFRK